MNEDQNTAPQTKPVDDGGPAFGTTHDTYTPCMTLRDYFASKADIPWDTARNALSKAHPEKDGFTVSEIIRARAEIKFAEADAMLAERAKEKASEPSENESLKSLRGAVVKAIEALHGQSYMLAEGGSKTDAKVLSGLADDLSVALEYLDGKDGAK